MPTMTQGVTFAPSATSASLDDGFQARLHDPLWLLARQWQFGEFQAEDTGSAARVRIESEQSPLARYRAGNGAAADYSAAQMPLETLVEREGIAAPAARPLALSAAAGLHFLRLLAANGAAAHQAAYRDHYQVAPLTPEEEQGWDEESRRARQLMVGRAPDAGRLYSDFSAALGLDGTGPGPLPPLPVIPSGDQPKVRAAARWWLQWVAAQGFSLPGTSSAWNPERMEYTFALAAKNNSHEAVLAAPEYHGGRLDWDTFVAQSGTTLGGVPYTRTNTQHLVPAPVAYHGMPHARLWAFENGRVNLGAVDGGNPDLATLVLLEFALVYGNDWFVAPVEVEVGALSRITALVVKDSFGVEQSLLHYTQLDPATSGWRMFALSPDAGGTTNELVQRSMLLTPAVGAALESSPVEEVLFLRDEMANMAWAVERVVAARSGLPLERYEQYQRAQAESEEESSDAGALADLSYRLGTTVPDYWIPLLPQETDVGGRLVLRLRRAAMPRFGPEGIEGIVEPVGTLLRPGEPLTLYGEEVPREGARVTRAAQYTRWINGGAYLWMGARKTPGRGEGSSGLRFDTVKQI